MTEHRVFGPPGTGKTTYLARQVANAVATHGADNVVVASFTRAAAVELIQRDMPVEHGNIGTLHALCYRALGSPAIAETKIADFNAAQSIYKLSGEGIDLDEPEQFFDTEADRIFAAYQVARAQMLPKEQWNQEVAAFARQWDGWKADTGYIDFTDMIEIALQERYAPAAAIGFFDEVQDFTRLELSLVRQWGEQMQTIVLAGDDDQCHIAGTTVMLASGEQRVIEDVRPGDLVVTYDKTGGAEVRRTGRVVDVASRQYGGELTTITVDGHAPLTSTNDHRMIARWQRDVNGHCVYVMRRGSSWRVGVSSLHRADGQFGPGQRLRQEDADALWLLGIYATRGEAIIKEALVAAQYGLAQLVFTTGGRRSVNVEQIALDSAHTLLAEHAHGVDALRDHGLDESLPLIERGKGIGMGPKAHFDVRACNLIAGWMEVPTVAESSKPLWMPFTTARTISVPQSVYSLNVEPYHTFAANGIIVRNCIYGFKGATPDAFLTPDVPADNKRTLNHSYRMSVSVWLAAQQWIDGIRGHREPKEYGARDAVGAVRMRSDFQYRDPVAMVQEVAASLDGAVNDEGNPRTAMIVGGCGYQLAPVVRALREQGLLFHNPYRRKRGDWNPLRAARGLTSSQRLLAMLSYDPAVHGDKAHEWTYGDLAAWTPLVRKTGVMRRGQWDKMIEGQPSDRIASVASLQGIFEAGVLDALRNDPLAWVVEHAATARVKGLEYPVLVAKKQGAARLMEQPRIIIGTIHSVKGGQADDVLVFPDLSPAGHAQWLNPTSRDDIIRQFYVGITRARETLILCGNSTPATIQWGGIEQ